MIYETQIKIYTINTIIIGFALVFTALFLNYDAGGPSGKAGMIFAILTLAFSYFASNSVAIGLYNSFINRVTGYGMILSCALSYLFWINTL